MRTTFTIENPLMTQAPTTLYSEQYFEWQLHGAAGSAEALLPLIFELVSPSSIVDVGCGTGAWLRVATQLGVKDVVGVDGGTSERVIPPESFRQLDLEQQLDLGRRFDLAMCMEVAEHLSEGRAPSLVADLCRAADIVLFSAAIPGQGAPGSGEHQNEQWQSYWAGLFSESGYRTVDAIRPLIWTRDEIAFWYRQNAFIAISPSTSVELDGSPTISDVVHPDLWRFVNADLWSTTASPRQLLRQLPRATTRAVRRRVARH